MPPCTWVLRLAHRSAAGAASVAATAAAYVSWSPPVAAARAASHTARGGQLGGDDHVGAVVLDRLEHGDRAAELQALLGVRRRQLGALAGDADRLGREDHAGEVDEHAPRAGEHGGRRAVEGDARGRGGSGRGSAARRP